jgi:hypothetical protein
VSKRSKRRRDPRTPGKEAPRDTQRAGEGIDGRRGASGGSPGRRAEGPRAEGRRAEGPRAEGRRAEGPRAEGRRAQGRRAKGRRAEGPRAGVSSSSWSLPTQIAFAVAVFAAVSLIAELAGAANLGVALGVGQIGFAVAVVYLLVRR